MDLVIVGSVAIDSVKTPSGYRENSIGGSALYASIAASKFCKSGIVGVVGKDFPGEVIEDLKKQNIDVSGLEVKEGDTFRWKGEYCDLNRAETLDTQLNVFAEFCPVLPEEYINSKYLFLGNIHPQLQLDVIKQSNAKIIVCDTMNFWINSTPELLNEVIKKVQVLFVNEDEIRLLTKKHNVFDAADAVLDSGPSLVVIKRGEYGAIAYSKDFMYFSPVYPVRNVCDPTGAGDSFAGGFMGYISQEDIFNEATIKKAMIIGTVTASINIESFSFDNLLNANNTEIFKRLDFLKKVVSVD